MKRIFIQVVFILFFSGLAAQTVEIERLFNEYRGEDEVLSMYIPGFLCRMGAALADLEEPERELMYSIKSVRLLISDNEELNRHVNFAREINHHKYCPDYSILLEVHDSGDDVLILGREKQGYVTDLLIVVGGSDNALISIRGRMEKDLLDALYNVTGIEECRYTRDI